MLTPRFLVVIGMILVAAGSRLIPHPPNFTPIAAIALFGGAYFSYRRLSFLIPFAAMLLSDLIIGLHRGMLVVYGSFALVVCIGFWLRKRKSVARIARGALASSILFFVTTNFSVWAMGSMYPKNIEGIVACYIAAIPFFQNALLGDSFYTAVLFGIFALVERRFPALNEV